MWVAVFLTDFLIRVQQCTLCFTYWGNWLCSLVLAGGVLAPCCNFNLIYISVLNNLLKRKVKTVQQ